MSDLKVPDILHALKLRNEDRLSYPAIARVMARYHDAHGKPEEWRYAVSAIGKPWRSPHGRAAWVKR